MKEAMHYSALEGGKVRCGLCPHGCTIADGKRGICGVRENRAGRLFSLVYGRYSSAHPDPIEKKPLYHFHPGSTALSFGTLGCNLRCLHCQNWEISQSRDADFGELGELRAADIGEWAGRTGSEGVAWTYNEPTIWHEFALEGSIEARKRGLYTVYVTNGYISEAPLREIGARLDAANVDVKAFTEKFYKEVSGARLQPVLDACKLYRELRVHLELTYLIIPTKNDSAGEMERFCRWVVKELGPDVPVHFSRFHPDYRLGDVGPTPVKKVVEAWEIGRRAGLEYVYGGNVPRGDYDNTLCPGCGSLLIERSGFHAEVTGLRDGRCQNCGTAVPVIGARPGRL
ncbi:MAG: AmmeMemoRadiSam system radical SAM enzyme [Euryarchaeota archaeon]|nr:AmmeMemoRadiSam system radical SAM enzyme [Euryarchaeota archaeon]